MPVICDCCGGMFYPSNNTYTEYQEDITIYFCSTECCDDYYTI